MLPCQSIPGALGFLEAPETDMMTIRNARRILREINRVFIVQDCGELNNLDDRLLRDMGIARKKTPSSHILTCIF